MFNRSLQTPDLSELKNAIQQCNLIKISKFCARDDINLANIPIKKSLMNWAEECLSFAKEEQKQLYRDMINMLKLYIAVAKLNKHANSLVEEYDTGYTEATRQDNENKNAELLLTNAQKYAAKYQQTLAAGIESKKYAILLKQQINNVYITEPNTPAEQKARRILIKTLIQAYRSNAMSNHRSTFKLIMSIIGLIITGIGIIIQSIQAFWTGQNQLIQTTRQKTVRQIEDLARKITGKSKKPQQFFDETTNIMRDAEPGQIFSFKNPLAAARPIASDLPGDQLTDEVNLLISSLNPSSSSSSSSTSVPISKNVKISSQIDEVFHHILSLRSIENDQEKLITIQNAIQTIEQEKKFLILIFTDTSIQKRATEAIVDIHKRTLLLEELNLDLTTASQLYEKFTQVNQSLEKLEKLLLATYPQMNRGSSLCYL